MKKFLFIGASLVLAACEAATDGLEEATPLDMPVPQASVISQEIVLDGTTEFVPAETPESRANETELVHTDDLNTTIVEANPDNATPELFGLSDENDFEAVSERQTVESDAERLAANRERYKLIEPTDIPQRPGQTGPNIVAYALATDNPLGEPLYKRFLLFMTSEKYVNTCGSYASPDLAQIAFLEAGGPEKDPLGIDPDGDGFACAWDPGAFRSVAGS